MINKTSIAIFLAATFVVSHLYVADKHLNHIRFLEEQLLEMNYAQGYMRDELMRHEAFQRQVECLAMNIYHEARSETYDGQLAVATVTMNRVEGDNFPETVCGVVWQGSKKGCQFSWTCDGKSDRIRNQSAYSKAIEMAENVLLNGLRSYKISRDVYHYHADYVDPKWEERWNAEMIAQVDSHKFYRVAYAD